MTEKQLQSCVMNLARLFHWRRYHTWLSARSDPGFLDCVLLRPPRLIIVELKGPRGRVSADQQAWIDDLRQVPGVETYLWTPVQWHDGTIEEVLR